MQNRARGLIECAVRFVEMFLTNGLIIILAYAGFGVVHSLMAGTGLKSRLSGMLGRRVVEGWYRLAYNVFAGLTFAPVALLATLLPDAALYRIPLPWAALMVFVQLLGLAGLVGAFFVTDSWHFAGLRQAWAYLTGAELPLPEPEMQEKGFYRLTRHPLYFFTLLVIWCMPVVTVNFFWSGVGITLYMVIGSLIEERRLLRLYPDTYRDYRRRVSWLIPLPHRLFSRVRREKRISG